MSHDRKLERLYDDHAAGLYAYLLGMVKSESEARDLLQELFIKLARISLPEALISERAYLWRMAHHLGLDALRRLSSRERAYLAAAQQPRLEFDAGDDPDAAELAESVATAMTELPEEQRSIAQMKLWDGLTFDEIATVLQLSPNTVASRYRYAMDKLRSRLRPLYQEITA